VDPHFSAGDYFEIEVHGIPTHVKNKKEAQADALMIASELTVMINTHRHSRWLVNVGMLQGGDAPNKIAGHAKLSGDIRALYERDRIIAERWLRSLVAKIQKNYPKSRIVLQYHRGYPVLQNEKTVIKRAQDILPINHTHSTFGTEDFSLYPMQKLFLLIGTGNKNELHTDDFNISPKTLEKLITYWQDVVQNLPLFVEK
jgi:metal-dependent amidase/aminoacylase/carboxypeptidase family protein